MKHLLVIALLLCAFFTAKAQTTDIIDSLDQTPQEQFEYISDNLDLSEVTSGLLSDIAWQLIQLDNYDGQHLADSNMAILYSDYGIIATN